MFSIVCLFFSDPIVQVDLILIWKQIGVLISELKSISSQEPANDFLTSTVGWQGTRGCKRACLEQHAECLSASHPMARCFGNAAEIWDVSGWVGISHWCPGWSGKMDIWKSCLKVFRFQIIWNLEDDRKCSKLVLLRKKCRGSDKSKGLDSQQKQDLHTKKQHDRK